MKSNPDSISKATPYRIPSWSVLFWMMKPLKVAPIMNATMIASRWRTRERSACAAAIPRSVVVPVRCVIP